MGVNGFAVASNDFISFVDSLGLLDLPFQGSQFTFVTSGNSIACNRLDRFFISNESSRWVHNVVKSAMFRTHPNFSFVR